MPKISAFAANNVLSISIYGNYDDYYCLANNNINFKVNLNTSSKGRLVIAVDGTLVFDNTMKKSDTISKTIKNIKSGEHTITAEYIYDSTYKIERASRKIFAYTNDAYKFINEIDNGYIKSGVRNYNYSERYKKEFAAYLASGKKGRQTMGGGWIVIWFMNEDDSNRIDTFTNKEYVKMLYRIYLHREGESTGVDWWTDQLNKGYQNRQAVWQFFANCDEYHKLLDSYKFKY